MKNSLYILYALMLFASCGGKQETLEENIETTDNIVITTQQWEAQHYQLVKTSVKSFSEDISVTGVIDIPPQNRAVISVKMEGYVKSINFLEGDYVKEGQLLFQLENPNYLEIQQSFLELHEQLTYLESEYNRYLKMKEENVVSEKVFLKAQSDYKTTKVKHDGLREQLALLNISVTQLEKGNFTSVINIYAPLAGYISNLKLAKGMFVQASFNALEILGNDHLHAEFFIYENDVLKIKEGQEVIFSPQSAPEQKIIGEIYLVGKALDENRRVKVHVHFKDTMDNLIAGMYIQGNIVTNKYEAKGLPTSSLVEVDNQHYALMLKEKQENDYVFSKVLMKTGSQLNDYMEIKNDFPENVQFLEKGVFFLID